MAIEMKLDELKKARSYDAEAPFPIPDAELCERYARLYTGAVNDVMREFAMVDQALPFDLVPLVQGNKFCGPAFTIRSAKDLRIEPEQEMESRARMLSCIPRGAVCVWDTNRDDIASHWGGMMTAVAANAGAVAAVVDGGIRDTHQILKKDFPIHYRYRSPNGLLGRCRITDYQTPIQIGTVIINPGDIVLGDYDGVMIIPRNCAYKVLLRTEELVHFERDIESWIEKGNSATDVVSKGGYF